MAIRCAVLLGALLSIACVAGAQNKPLPNEMPLSPIYMPSGQHLYTQFCAACHGTDAKGNGPAAYSLKVPPLDLTTLAKRHEEKFPYAYVSSVLLFGPGVGAHGSTDMPTWGPVFMFLDKHDESAVRQRIKNLSDYLASLQEK